MGQKYSCPRCGRTGTLKSLQKKECAKHSGRWENNFSIGSFSTKREYDDNWRLSCCHSTKRKNSECSRYLDGHESLVIVK